MQAYDTTTSIAGRTCCSALGAARATKSIPTYAVLVTKVANIVKEGESLDTD